MESARRFFRQSWLSFKSLFGWAEPVSYVFVKILNPIFQLSFFCLLDGLVYGPENISRYVLGNAMVLCAYNCVFGIGMTLTEERYFGTLKLVVVSPANNLFTFMQRGVIHIVDSMVTVLVSLAAGALLFGANFSRINPLDFMAVMAAGVLSACCFGLLLGSLGLVIDNINMLLNLVSLGFLALTGANFPVERLPAVLRAVSNCLPLTRSIKLGGAILNGERLGGHLPLLLGELSLAAVYLALGYACMLLCERLAEVRGNLDIY